MKNIVLLIIYSTYIMVISFNYKIKGFIDQNKSTIILFTFIKLWLLDRKGKKPKLSVTPLTRQVSR